MVSLPACFFSSLPGGSNKASSVWAVVEKWEYVALPFFILMGELLFWSGISEWPFESLVPWRYHLPGGLLLTNIVSCMLFAAVSGSSATTTATVGRIILAEVDGEEIAVVSSFKMILEQSK